MRGSRVQTIVNELHGEKIDIIKWTEDLPTLISESLSPAEIQKVLIDQDNNNQDSLDKLFHYYGSDKANIFKKKHFSYCKKMNAVKWIDKTNFDYKRIKTLYSNLSSLSILQLFELKNNYKKLNYSLTEVNLQILKILTYPMYLVLITIMSALIMFKIKRLDNTTLKISLGLFISVIIYYINNFFLVMGSTERIPLIFAIFIPLILIGLINSYMVYRINEK